ncbi:sialin-like [Pomacea canaliculata]|uniref:sialin-like n=1 Tax=Pomacea canaliculata TaxID=400727 RepID=UPI000D73BF41|nr:sialin-like [Pomacea canaliculata]
MGSIFYLSGLGNLLWVVVWFVVTADTPTKHKWISEAEKNYILRSIGETPEDKEILPTPWRAILTSAPVWACIIGQMCGAYTAYTLLTSLPAFMKEVLKFDIKQNGGLSALPYLCETVVVLVTGQVADRLRERGILSTKNTRKLFQITANVGSAICLISAGYMNCTQRPLAVLLLCLCLSFMGLRRAGYSSNHIDLAPRHAGVIFGIANTAGTVPGMIAPLVVGALTPNRTAEEWRRVFFVCAALSLLGTIVYGIFADGELQSWAAPPVELVIKECQEVKGGDKNHNDETHENHKNPAFEPSDCDCRDISPEEATSNTAEGLHSPQKVEAQN